MKKLFILISLLLISNTALAISLGDLKKTLENATEEIKKEIETPKEQNTEITTEQKPKKIETQNTTDTTKKIKTDVKKVSDVETDTASKFIGYCKEAEKLEKRLNFTKLDKFDFMKDTNLRIMNFETAKYQSTYEFLIKDDLGKGKAKLDFKDGGDLILTTKWTMLDNKTLAMIEITVGGSKYQFQDGWLKVYSLKNEKELEYVFCPFINTPKISDVRKVSYKLDSGITEAEYEKSTEGILHRSYVFYQILRKLHKSRESYAIKYVTDQQINEMKEKVKFIEDQAVKKDNINSDEIWKKATETYENDYAYSVDAVEASGQYVTEGKQLANLSMMDINNSFKEFGGNSNVEKDF